MQDENPRAGIFVRMLEGPGQNHLLRFRPRRFVCLRFVL
jgi:hypothetical protein